MNKLKIGNIVRVNKGLFATSLYYELAEINDDEAKLFFIGRKIEYAKHRIVKLKDLIKVRKNSYYTKWDKELRELVIERNYKNKEVQ